MFFDISLSLQGIAVTGPISHYLQSIHIDIIKVLDKVDTALTQLTSLRKKSYISIDLVEKIDADSSWPSVRVRRHKKMDGESVTDDAPENREEQL